MKNISIFLLAFLFTSCIPLRIAPRIKDDKIQIAKRFKRKLPREYAYIFKDPKDADEFYNYINTKFQLNHISVDDNVPLEINGTLYYLSFYETEIPDKTLNLLPILIDAKLETDLLQNAYTSRSDHWYLVLIVRDETGNSCLTPEHKNKQEVVAYLKSLKSEYLSTYNYYEALLKQKKP